MMTVDNRKGIRITTWLNFLKIPEYDERQSIEDGISEKNKGILRAEEIFEIGQPRPGAFKNSHGIIYLFKSEDQSRHGHVIVDDQIKDAGQKHDVQRKKSFHFLQSPAPFIYLPAI